MTQSDRQTLPATTEVMPKDDARRSALALIKRQRTMVLATCRDHLPWSAPVYYLYFAPGFYFFSSPNSLHIRHILASDPAAASIHADGERLEDLEGLQMNGRVEPIAKPLLKMSVTGRYLVKFPMARPFLGGTRSTARDLRKSVLLYAFIPHTAYYMNHHTGFGVRTAVDLSPDSLHGDHQ